MFGVSQKKKKKKKVDVCELVLKINGLRVKIFCVHTSHNFVIYN